MIQSTQTVIEQRFNQDWTGDIHFSNTSKRPNSDTWIHLDVEPIANDANMSNCGTEHTMLYVYCYAPNKVKAAQLADSVASFIQRTNLGSVYIRVGQPAGRGEAFEGLFYYRTAFPVDELVTY